MHLNVVTTLRCNLSCAHCIYGCPQEEELHVDAFRETLRDLQAHGLTSLTFSGGEPALHPELPQMVELAAGHGLAVGFVSNGGYVDRYSDLVRRHGRYGLEMALSLDGLEATHDRMRARGSFAQVSEAARRYRALGVTTTVNCMVTDDSLGELAAVVDLAASLGAAAVKVAGLLPTRRGGGRTLSSSSRESVFEEAQALSREHGIPVNVANSVYHPVTVEFCPVLTHDVLTLHTSGALTFCCDVPGSGGRLGAGNRGVEAVLARRQRTIDELLLHRIIKARAGEMTLEDQSCLFCHDYFGAWA